MYNLNGHVQHFGAIMYNGDNEMAQINMIVS